MSELRFLDTVELDAAPVLDRFGIVQGSFENGQALVRLGAMPEANEVLAVVVRYLDGSVSVQNFSAGTVECRVPIDDSRIIRWIHVYGAAVEGHLFRLATQREHYHLDRVFATSLDEVNANIRWHGRIEHFPSRVLAAKNSFKLLNADLNSAVYCLVAIGYTALENGDEPVKQWVYDQLQPIYRERLGELKGEAKFSFLAHLLHYAIYFGNVSVFEKVVRTNELSLPEIESAPVCAFNAIVILMLGGIFYYQLGWPKRAAEIFQQGDFIFRVAANGYPRTAHMYRELTVICTRAYQARVGFEASGGGRLRTELGVTMFDVSVVAGEVSRVYVPAAKKIATAKLLDLIKKKVEMRASARKPGAPGAKA